MVESNNRRRAAIVGIGETEVGKLPGRTVHNLHVDAVAKAIADAGLDRTDVDGLITNSPTNDFFRSYANYLASLIGIAPTFATDLALGGATPVAMAQVASMAIASGMCDVVVCVHARNDVTGRDEPFRARIRNGGEDFEEPYGVLGAPARHAAVAQRHMHEFGTTSEQLGAIAVAARKHAALTPGATKRDQITIDDYMQSRMIVEPLRLLDCCLVSDGGGAFVVTSVERARDMPRPPVYITGMGQHHIRNNLLEDDCLTTGGGAVSSRRAMQMANCTPADIDFAEIYDCFTMTTLITLEDYGFCPKGDGGAWVEGGRIELGGELPVNTHGGLLSHSHVEGMLHITEAVKQLRREVEPERQVPDATLGIVSGHGASFHTHSTIVLSNTDH